MSIREKNARNIAYDYFDKILEVYDLGDCFEFVGRMGGDTLTFRIYENGDVYER